MVNNSEIYTIILKLEAKRDQLQREVLDVNEAQILQADYKDRAELFKSHNAIIDVINMQTETIDLLVNELIKSYSKEYVQDLQNTIKKFRAYVKDLGGNPSVINFIKNEDISDAGKH